jgi:hypothetical protein
MRAAFTSIAVVLVVGAFSAGCESKRIEGTYADATGTIVLELKKDGAARFTDSTRSEECKYTVGVDTIPLTCPGGERIFAVGQDGSLTTPNIMGVLKKMP